MNLPPQLRDDRCARCQGPLHAGTDTARCPGCGALYHDACFAQKGCLSPGCGVNIPHGSGVHAEDFHDQAAVNARPRLKRGGRDVAPRLLVLALLGTALATALASLLAWALLRPPAVAGRAYQRGIRSQLAGDATRAAAQYEAALAARPGLAEAALALGYARLGFRGKRLDQSDVRSITEEARLGRTAKLDAADEAFGQCLTAASRLDPDRPAQALFASTNREMIAAAWVGKALTAIVRAAAGYGAGNPLAADQWVAAALSDLDAADRAAPTADAGELRRLAQKLQQRRR